MKSVGEILRKARQEKKLTLQDIHKFIKIHPRYLTALEKSNYSVFSGKVHAKGFLKIYADFLGLEVDEVLAFWRREYEAGFEKKVEKKREISLRPLETYKLRVTPGLIFGVLFGFLLLTFFGYLYFQYKTYSGAPELMVYTPENNVVVATDIFDVTGKTERDSVVFINNQRVIVSPDGSFATSIKLNPGLNTLSFMAINKLGKETEEIRTIIYRPLAPEVAGVEDVVEATESVEGE